MGAYRAGDLWGPLADPTRRAIVECLAEHPRAVGELAEELPVSRPAVSQHLKVLKDAGLVTDRAAKTEALRVITEHLTPGQWGYAREPSAKELAATSVLALPLDEASVKIRNAGPVDEPEDYDRDVWAGVVPVTSSFGPPEPDEALRPGIAAPAHITARR